MPAVAITARKLFSRTVTHPGDGVGGSAAISLAALLRLEGWGFVPGANNAIGSADLSEDSFTAIGATLIPQTADAYIGDDQYVSSAANVGPPRVYRGSKVTATQPYSLQENFPPPIDADNIFIYSVTQDFEIIFQGQ